MRFGERGGQGCVERHRNVESQRQGFDVYRPVIHGIVMGFRFVLRILVGNRILACR